MGSPKSIDKLSPHHRIWFFTLAQSDFGAAVAAARTAIELKSKHHSLEESLTYNALAECAVIRYARPFTRCVLPQERAPGDPDPPQLSTKLPKDFVHFSGRQGADTVHDAAMKLRDQYFAHSDATVRQVRFELIRDGELVRLRNSASARTVSPNNLARLMRLAEALAAHLHGEISTLLKEGFPKLKPGQVATFGFHRGLR